MAQFDDFWEMYDPNDFDSIASGALEEEIAQMIELVERR